MEKMELYSFFNSSTSFRVRIALELKGLDYSIVPINLRRKENLSEGYMAVNPFHGVPVLRVGKTLISQSLNIMRYLDQIKKIPKLFPDHGVEASYVNELCQFIACEIHPVNNLRVLRYLESAMGATPEAVQDWYKHWVAVGFTSLEKKLESCSSGQFAVGDRVSAVECCIIPQVANALRNGCAMEKYPLINGIYLECMKLDAFQRASPANQVDYV